MFFSGNAGTMKEMNAEVELYFLLTNACVPTVCSHKIVLAAS